MERRHLGGPPGGGDMGGAAAAAQEHDIGGSPAALSEKWSSMGTTSARGAHQVAREDWGGAEVAGHLC